MDLLIANITGAVAQHPGVATLVAFAGAIIEAVAVLGVIIPGTPILMAVAASAAAAGLSVTPILIAGVAGAVIGDGISFWVGKRYGGRIRTIWPFASRPRFIERAETFFARFGGPGVGLARFIPVLRSTVPLVAGMAGMPIRRFLAANILSALVWAPAHIFPAQLAGLSMERLLASDWRMATQIGAALLAALGVGWLAYALMRKRLETGVLPT